MSDAFLDYIEDILDAMNKAELILQGVKLEEFEADFRINFAVVWNVVQNDIPKIEPLIQQILADFSE